MRTHIAGPTWFAVTHDVFCNYCIPPEQLVVREVNQTLFPRRLKGVASETTLHCDGRIQRFKGVRVCVTVCVCVCATVCVCVFELVMRGT